MSKDLTPFISADYLDDAESIAAYLGEYIAEGANPEELIVALGRVARAKGMAEVADKAGLGRESLYKSLAATGNPSWITVNKVLAALGLTVKIGVVSKMAVQAKRTSVSQATGTYGGGASMPSGPVGRREMAVAASALTQAKSARETTGKKVAASALTQTKGANESTGKKVASSAAKIMRDPKASATAKSVAASALTQKKK